MNFTQLFRRKPIQDLLSDSELPDTQMKRSLGVVDLTGFGIAAIIGAGIFSTIGNAAFHGGPAVTLLFVFTAIACAFSALCYAEFASSLPISGSAYTYAYATLGEFIAWIIGWDLLMEYAIGNIAVAISWSDYFTALLAGYDIHLPAWITMDYLSASRGFQAVQAAATASGLALTEVLADTARFGISGGQLEAYQAWSSAPRIFGAFPLIFDIPALLVIIAVTVVVFIGIQESKRVSNIMVGVKIAVLLLVIGLGAFFVKPENWSPFAPNGMGGVLKGVSAVFFAYIGFDAISTTAEECKNPQRDLPRAMMFSLVICTILYIAVALVLTGVVHHSTLQVGDPLAYVFGPEGANISWISGVIAVSAVVALFTVLLVFQLGQPRIWMAMSRDGLLPPIFSALHPKFRTPWFSTILAGFLVAIPSLFMNLTEVTDLTSIGTLFAFLVVCAGVLRLDPNRPRRPGQFRMPYVNAQWIFPALVGGTLALGVALQPQSVSEFLAFGDWETFRHKIPLWIYLLGMIYLAAQTWRKCFSLIPVLGLATCGYLITELGLTNWTRFGIWLLLGLGVYFLYGSRHSKLHRSAS